MVHHAAHSRRRAVVRGCWAGLKRVRSTEGLLCLVRLNVAVKSVEVDDGELMAEVREVVVVSVSSEPQSGHGGRHFDGAGSGVCKGEKGTVRGCARFGARGAAVVRVRGSGGPGEEEGVCVGGVGVVCEGCGSCVVLKPQVAAFVAVAMT